MIGESLAAWTFGTLESALQSTQNAGWGDSKVKVIEYTTTKEERVVYDNSI